MCLWASGLHLLHYCLPLEIIVSVQFQLSTNSDSRFLGFREISVFTKSLPPFCYRLVDPCTHLVSMTMRYHFINLPRGKY